MIIFHEKRMKENLKIALVATILSTLFLMEWPTSLITLVLAAAKSIWDVSVSAGVHIGYRQGPREVQRHYFRSRYQTLMGFQVGKIPLALNGKGDLFHPRVG